MEKYDKVHNTHKVSDYVIAIEIENEKMMPCSLIYDYKKKNAKGLKEEITSKLGPIDKHRIKKMAEDQQKIGVATIFKDRTNIKSWIKGIVLGALGVATVSGALYSADRENEQANANLAKEQQNKDDEQKESNDQQENLDMGVTSAATIDGDIQFFQDSNEAQPSNNMMNMENKNIVVNRATYVSPDGTIHNINYADTLNLDAEVLKQQFGEGNIMVHIANIDGDISQMGLEEVMGKMNADMNSKEGNNQLGWTNWTNVKPYVESNMQKSTDQKLDKKEQFKKDLQEKVNPQEALKKELQENKDRSAEEMLR